MISFVWRDRHRSDDGTQCFLFSYIEMKSMPKAQTIRNIRMGSYPTTDTDVFSRSK